MSISKSIRIWYIAIFVVLLKNEMFSIHTYIPNLSITSLLFLINKY